MQYLQITYFKEKFERFWVALGKISQNALLKILKMLVGVKSFIFDNLCFMCLY